MAYIIPKAFFAHPYHLLPCVAYALVSRVVLVRCLLDVQIADNDCSTEHGQDRLLRFGSVAAVGGLIVSIVSR